MNLNRNFFIRFCLFSLWKEYPQAYQYLNRYYDRSNKSTLWINDYDCVKIKKNYTCKYYYITISYIFFYNYKNYHKKKNYNYDETVLSFKQA